MSKIKKLSLFLASLLLGLGLLSFISPKTTSAAAARCFVVNSSTRPPSVSERRCRQDERFRALLLAQNGAGSTFRQNHCYILGITPALIVAPNDNPFCVNARRNSTGINQGGNNNNQGQGGPINTGALSTPPDGGEGKTCGTGKTKVTTSINFGCRGQGNAIVDMLFAFTRILSVAVGLVIVGSIIVGGIQYAASAGKPEATSKAISRISNSVIALLFYLLIFAILNWIIPSGLF